VNLSKKYDYATQHLFISMMLTDPELYTRCSNILLPSYFDKKLAPAVKFLINFAEEHNGLPNKQIINTQTNMDFEILEINESHKDWFLDSIEDFCKSKAIEKAILSGAQMLEEGKYGDIEKLIKDAVLISLQRDLGTDYFADPKQRLEKLKEMNGTVSTGWKSVDNIAYQIGFGELILFTAISGGGKSVAMQNATVNFALQGFNVVYYTLELSEELTAKRLDAMCTGVSNINIFKDIDNVALKVKTISKTSGNIHIKYMPAGSTPNDIKAHLREFTIQKGFKPDVIVVDYLDLLHPNQARIDVGNFFVKDKLVAEALRSLASPKDFNLICVSASQVNRCLTLDTKVIKNGKEDILSNVKIGDVLDSSEGPVTVKQVYEKTTQPVYHIKTKSGKSIKCSSKHDFPTPDGIKNLNTGLCINDKFYTVDSIDEIISIEYVGELETMDIEVSGNRLFYANGILTHNSGYTETIPGMENMAGGMSKAHTADLIMHIHNTAQLRERGEIEYQFIKTRNSGGVGTTLTMAYDTETLRITDMQSSGSSSSGVSNSSSSDNNDNKIKALLNKLNK
jgi:archaellum biogenesis ATPase FlaH